MNILRTDEYNRSVLLFVRYPEKGTVKTRLETHFNQDEILGLYRCFVADILATLQKCGFPVTICFLPPARETEMEAWLGPVSAYVPQTGKDLGQRMKNAFVQAFTLETSPVDPVILLGSDVPDLDPEIIHQAFDSLTSSDMALGPAIDGGYYLIGFNRHAFSKNLFDGISWGTRQVFKETMQKIERAGLKVHVLPQWRDIDHYDDLESFYRRARDKELAHLKTMQYLQTMMPWSRK